MFYYFNFFFYFYFLVYNIFHISVRYFTIRVMYLLFKKGHVEGMDTDMDTDMDMDMDIIHEL